MDERQSWIRSYFPAFDGLRALAVLSVFYCHYGYSTNPHLHMGITWSGVDLFFVLSGFLITGILYDSRKSSDYFSRFYLRRALRILPLPLGFFLLVRLLRPLLHLRYSRYLWTTPLFVSNLLVKGTDLGLHGNPMVVIVPHAGEVDLGSLWSLCVEQQFYLIWPLIVWFFPRRRALMWVCGGGVVGTLLLRLYLYTHSSAAELATGYLYYSTYSRCDTLLAGAWMAVWLRGTKLTRSELRTRGFTLLLAGVVCLWVLVLTMGRPGLLTAIDPSMQTFGYTLTALASAGLILLSLDETFVLNKVLRHSWLVGLGRISYGFYFFHALPHLIFDHVRTKYLAPHSLGLLEIVLAFAYAWTAAALSFRFWESPFLRLKDRVPASHASVPTGQEGGRPSVPVTQ